MPSERNKRRALRRIVSVLRKRNVPFHITGGLAASVYGSPRRWNDIDILIRPAALQRILPDIKKCLVFGPARYRDRHFDSFMAALKMYGTKIDIGMWCRIRNHRTGKWYLTPGPTAFSYQRIFGLRVKVEAKWKLMRVKQILGRKKDLADCAAMQEI